ncbi:uncharacterized protein LOC135280816 isoform X3 [Passer domesticus]
MAPVRDVFELRHLLEHLGFQVVSLLDLNKAEMATAVTQFLQLLGKGVYAIFYYAGHGYEHLGRNYMVPVDAPQPYAPENCISVQRILQKMQQQQTALNIILLDTCRKWYNPGRALSQVQPLEPWGNTVYGYSTSEDAEAYELQDGEFSSGIFMKYLKKHILQEKKVTHMLEDVLEDIGRDPLVTGKQVMEIRHTLKEARSLTDPICPSGAAAEHWGHSQELPSRTVTFPCGARVELRFLRLFSNLMFVCAKPQPPLAHVTEPQLLLRQLAETDDVAIQRESCLDHVETLLASVYKREELDCVFQLCALQRIQSHPTAITWGKWRHRGKNSSSPCHPGKCMGKPWCSPATAATGDIASPGEGKDTADQETLLHQEREWTLQTRRHCFIRRGNGHCSHWRHCFIRRGNGHCRPGDIASSGEGMDTAATGDIASSGEGMDTAATGDIASSGEGMDTAATGDIASSGEGMDTADQETLLHQERILRRLSCHRLESGSDSLRGNWRRRGVTVNPTGVQQP